MLIKKRGLILRRVKQEQGLQASCSPVRHLNANIYVMQFLTVETIINIKQNNLTL